MSSEMNILGVPITGVAAIQTAITEGDALVKGRIEALKTRILQANTAKDTQITTLTERVKEQTTSIERLSSLETTLREQIRALQAEKAEAQRQIEALGRENARLAAQITQTFRELSVAVDGVAQPNEQT